MKFSWLLYLSFIALNSCSTSNQDLGKQVIHGNTIMDNLGNNKSIDFLLKYSGLEDNYGFSTYNSVLTLNHSINNCINLCISNDNCNGFLVEEYEMDNNSGSNIDEYDLTHNDTLICYLLNNTYNIEYTNEFSYSYVKTSHFININSSISNNNNILGYVSSGYYYDNIDNNVTIYLDLNHNGNLDMAKQLIDIASNAGADIVKFQTFKANKIVTKKLPKVEYQKQLNDIRLKP